MPTISELAKHPFEVAKKSVLAKAGDIWEAHPEVREKFWDAIESRLERNIMETIHPKYEPGALEEYDAAIDQGYTPFYIISMHGAHLDGAPFARVTEHMLPRANARLPEGKKLKGVKLIVAFSMGNGGQGIFLKEGYERVAKPVTKRGIEFINYVRDKDATEDTPADEYALAMEVGQALDDGYAIALLPEGTVEAGRRPENAKHYYDINGMQPFKESAIQLINVQFQRHGKKPLFITIAPFGSHKIQDVNNNMITPKGLSALFSPQPQEIIQVRVGMPIRGDELYQQLGVKGKAARKAINEYFGGKAARMEPPRARGIWRGKV